MSRDAARVEGGKSSTTDDATQTLWTGSPVCAMPECDRGYRRGSLNGDWLSEDRGREDAPSSGGLRAVDPPRADAAAHCESPGPDRSASARKQTRFRPGEIGRG